MKKQKKKIKIKIEMPKVAIGHQESTHQVHDSRPKRKRTRQAQRSVWMKESY